MDLTVWIVITVVSLFFSALFSGTEMAYVTADRVRVEIDIKRGGMISRIIKRFYANAEFFISSILVGNNVMLVIYGMGAAALLEAPLARLTDNEAVILLAQTLISTAVILLTGEFIPKTIFKINPNSSLKIIAIPVYLFYLLLYPLSLLASALSKGLMRLVGAKDSNKRLSLISIGDLNDYLEETIDTMEEKKTRVENEVKIFQNALDFSSTHLRDCMIPRNEIIAVDFESATRESLCELFMSTGRSKILVYRDDIDNIVGYVHVRELFDTTSDWRQHLMPVLYGPENLLANKMMRRLLQQKRSIAIVIDEFGGTAGLVTLEDLVEEIFGDIQDEHDSTKLTSRCVAPGVYEFSGRCEIAEINEIYNLDIPEDESYQTLAGYILESIGSIPEAGESVVIDERRFDIIKKSATRLELIRLTLPTETTGGE